MRLYSNGVVAAPQKGEIGRISGDGAKVCAEMLVARVR
jgi:hypothetical protein